MTDAAAESDSGAVFHLIYRSVSLIDPEHLKEELGQLFSAARSTNKRQQITGALLCVDDCFVQMLEGEETAVRALLEHISADPRHECVELLESGPLEQRVFSRWAMARVTEDGEPDIPLIAHRDGISPAAGRRTTAEQDRLLDMMRRAARGESHAR